MSIFHLGGRGGKGASGIGKTRLTTSSSKGVVHQSTTMVLRLGLGLGLGLG